MWRTIINLAGLAVYLTLGSRALAEVRVDVVDVSPATTATLGRDEPCWLRVRYTTDEPVNLWARPYFQGSPLKRVRTNASPRYTGSGYALGWFSLDEAADVDEVRIFAGSGNPWREWQVAALNVQIHGSGRTSPAAPKAPWVDELLQAQESAARLGRGTDTREPAAASGPSTAASSDSPIFSGFALFLIAVGLAGIGVPLWSVWKWRGGWRIAAGLPVFVLAFVIGRIVIDTARDPSSHNLWPFEIIMFAVLSLGAIGLLKLFRRLRGIEE